MILRDFISLRAFTFYMENSLGLKFHFCQIDRKEICTEVGFTPHEVMWTLIIKLPHTEVKSRTRLCALRFSCKRALFEFASHVNVLLRRTLLSIFKVHSAYCRVPPPIAWSNGASWNKSEKEARAKKCGRTECRCRRQEGPKNVCVSFLLHVWQ